MITWSRERNYDDNEHGKSWSTNYNTVTTLSAINFSLLRLSAKVDIVGYQLCTVVLSSSF